MFGEVDVTFLSHHSAVFKKEFEDRGVAFDLDVDDLISAILDIFDMAVKVSHLAEHYFAIRNESLHHVFCVIDDLDFYHAVFQPRGQVSL